MKDLNQAKKVLSEKNYTCVLCQDDMLFTSTRRGVAPLIACIENEQSYSAFSAADKVVGKATAFLYVLLGVKAVYARVISKAAIQVLNEHAIFVEYDALVENIINRQGDGICPFEAAVLDVIEPTLAYKTIRQKMSEMNIKI